MKFSHFAFLIMLCSSCSSYISDDERLIYVRPADVARVVLIEDFTGQNCLNCPVAADTIASLQRQYGDSVVIAVGIHGGPLARYSTATALGLRTAEGDAYVENWGVANTLPKGMVNRSGGIRNYDQWPTAVREAASAQSVLRLGGTATFDAQSRQLTVSLTALSADDMADARLQLWLTESGITAMQRMPDGSLNRDYVHNHVLRSVVNGLWGESLPLAAGVEQRLSRSVAVAPEWRPEQLAVVAFVYTDAGVQQVVELKVRNQ